MKTGDIVICLRAPNTAHQRFEGAIRSIGEVSFVGRFGVHWKLEPPTSIGGFELVWSAAYLRKVDAPNDDATDETLGWLPVPTKETEHA